MVSNTIDQIWDAIIDVFQNNDGLLARWISANEILLFLWEQNQFKDTNIRNLNHSISNHCQWIKESSPIFKDEKKSCQFISGRRLFMLTKKERIILFTM